MQAFAKLARQHIFKVEAHQRPKNERGGHHDHPQFDVVVFEVAVEVAPLDIKPVLLQPNDDMDHGGHAGGRHQRFEGVGYFGALFAAGLESGRSQVEERAHDGGGARLVEQGLDGHD